MSKLGGGERAGAECDGRLPVSSSVVRRIRQLMKQSDHFLYQMCGFEVSPIAPLFSQKIAIRNAGPVLLLMSMGKKHNHFVNIAPIYIE